MDGKRIEAKIAADSAPLLREIELLESRRKTIIDERAAAQKKAHEEYKKQIEEQRQIQQQLYDGLAALDEEQARRKRQEQIEELDGWNEIYGELKQVRKERQKIREELERMTRSRHVDREEVARGLEETKRLTAEEQSLSAKLKAAEQEEAAEFKKAAEERRKIREQEIAEAQKQFQTEVNLLKQKLLEEKQLREGGPTTTALGQFAGRFDQKKVLGEIMENRLQAGAARKERAGVAGRKLTPAEVRRQVLREFQRGQIGQREVTAAQVDLLQKTAVQGFKTGKFSQVQAAAMHAAATELERQNAEVEKNTEQITQIQKFITQQGKAGQRRQAQRRGTRG